MPLLALTAACSGNDSAPVKVGSLAAVTVTNATDPAKVVDFKAPLAFSKSENKVVQAGPGTGPKITASSLVTVKYVGINATDQSDFGDNWEHGPSTFYVNSVVKAFTQGLIGKQAGDRVLIVSPAKDAFGDTGNVEATVRPGDSVIFVVDIETVASVQPPPDTVPQLQYDATGNPSKFVAGAGVTAKPGKLGVYPVIEGTGPVVKAGDTVNVDYFGQLYPAKTVFNAWTGQPFDFKLGTSQVIDGWDQGVTGQRVGTRLVLVVPPDLAYKGKAQQGIPANSTLIFTIEILSVNAS